MITILTAYILYFVGVDQYNIVNLGKVFLLIEIVLFDILFFICLSKKNGRSTK